MASIEDVLTWFGSNGPLTYHDVNIFSVAFIVLFVTILLAFVFGVLFLFGELFKFIFTRLKMDCHIPLFIYNFFIYTIYVIWTFLGGILMNFFFVAPTYGSPCNFIIFL